MNYWPWFEVVELVAVLDCKTRLRLIPTFLKSHGTGFVFRFAFLGLAQSSHD